MKHPAATNTLFNGLRQSAKPEPMSAIEKLIRDGPDRELCRINALAFAAKHSFDEDDVIAAFLHGARLDVFDMSWNILCPACGGVLDSGATLGSLLTAKLRSGCNQMASPRPWRNAHSAALPSRWRFSKYPEDLAWTISVRRRLTERDSTARGDWSFTF